MPVSQDTRQALRLLERLQRYLKESDSSPSDPTVGEDLNTLISVLDSPVFNSILTIQDSIQELKRQLHKHPSILPVDFDISPTTGELILNTPADAVLLQNSDSYEPSSDPEQNYEYDNQISKGRIAIQQDGLQNENPDLSVPADVPPDYALSTITTDSYAEEFQKTIDQGAQGREIHTLQLFKPEGSSLGFSVVGLRSEQKGELGIFIQEIQPNGIAGRDGHLQEGDQILAIDGQPLDSNISHQQAISILQQARGLVELVVARGGILTNAEQSTPSVSIERSPSAVSANSKSSDMVLNTEWAQVESIDLINDGAGLGFGIIGGRSTGVVVKTILPGGVADRDGRLQSGDHILQIGDVNLRGMGSEQVAMVLRQSGSHVRLIVARPVDPTSPDYQTLRSNAPIVPTRILADAEEVEKHLAMFQQTQNGFPEPLPYKGPPDVDANFIYQRELNGTDEFYNSAFLPSSVDLSSAAKLGRGAAQDSGDDLPEMETFEVELVKDQQGLGITIAGYVCEKEEISGIFVKSIAKGSAADMCGQIRVNDQIIEVDGRSLHGYTNHQAVEVLRNTGKVIKLRLARYLRGTKYQQLQQAIASGELSYPNPVVQAQIHEPKSLPITEASNRDVDVTDFSHQISDHFEGPLDSKTESAIQAKWNKIMGPEYEIVVAQLSKFREGGGLGISLEGTVDVEDGKEVRPHHYIRSILADGPVGVNGRLHGGDELLEVNGVKLLGMNHHGVVATLKELPMHVRMVCTRRLLPADRGVVLPSLGDADSPHPYHKLDYDLSTMPEFPERGMLSGPFGGSLTSLTPVSERLVKAKSDGSLAVGTSASSSPPVEVTLSKLKSRSLEPLTGLAMWSSEPQIIELIKGDRGLGFSILDYQDPMNPNETVIVIRSLVPGGVAQQDGRLIPGDRLLFVNDINLENASLDAAVQALKGAPKGVVRIGVAKPLPLPESSQSGQVTWEVGLGVSDLSRKPSFDLPPHVQSYGMDSDQPSSLPTKILPSTELKLAAPLNNTGQIAKVSSTDTTDTDRREENTTSPSTEQISKHDIAPFPPALERTVRIKKGSDVLGLYVDVLEAIGGVVVSSLAPDGAVAKNGQIEPGDFLLSVNGNPFINATVDEAARILHLAEKLNTDVIVKYVPAADAAVHHQSALMSLNRESELLNEAAQIAEARSESIATGIQVKGDEDLDQPPDSPPPPPPPPSFASMEEEEEEKEEYRMRVKPIFEKNVVVTKADSAAASLVQPVSSVSTFKPFKATVSVPLYEERKPFLSAQITKPAVPLKPLRSSLLSPFDIPVREKSKLSSVEGGLTGELTTLSRQWGPERTVELNRDPSKGLGISIISGKAETSHGGIYIKNVLPDSPAGWNGTLKRGDRILEVSGIDLRSATHAKAVEVIKNAQNPVVFVVQSLVPVPKKLDSGSASPETKTAKLPHSPLTEQTSASATLSSHTHWSPTTDVSLQLKEKVAPKYSPVSGGPSPTETSERVKVTDREPPLPPPRTVSRIPKIPLQSKDEEQDSRASKVDQEKPLSGAIPHSIHTQGKVLTKNGVEIDFGSAGNVKLSADERSQDPGEEEDEFGYTPSKPFVFAIR